jgi:hypothetical protein
MFNEHSQRKVLVIIAFALLALALEGALLVTGIASIDINTVSGTAGSGSTAPVKPAAGSQDKKAQDGQGSNSVSVEGMGSQSSNSTQAGNKPALGGQGSSSSSGMGSGQGMSGQGMSGQGMSGQGMSGQGMSGQGMSGGSQGMSGGGQGMSGDQYYQ